MARSKQTTADEVPEKTVGKTPEKKPEKKLVKKDTEPKTAPESKRTPLLLRPFKAIGAYFKGSWVELRQTKWPTRRASWSLTLAVIIFTAVLMLFIVAIDYLFDLLFKSIIL